MNGNPYTSAFIGATNAYPIYDFVVSTSNILELHSSNFTTNTSNILQTQINNTSNLIYKDKDLNTIVRITAQNDKYPLIGSPIEMRFQNMNNEYLTKITQTGELFVYHPYAPLPLGYDAGWWSVENKIANLLNDTIGLRFDVTNLQIGAGNAAVTNSGEAAATVAASGAEVAAVGAGTAAAGTAIAGGDYGAVALGAAGGALFAAIGYISYQAQRESNLTSNGYTTEAAAVQTNINTANLLIATNISNICKATGFVNCNITTAQTIPYINTGSITLNSNSNVSNVSIPNNGLSIGAYSSNVWMSFSSNCSNQIYFNGNKTIEISSNLINFTGTINAVNLTSNNTTIPSIAQTTILTATPNVMKKTGFLINVHNPVYINSDTASYSYDLYLPSYTSQAIVESSSDPYRIFKIYVCYASSYFEYLSNGLPNCLSYEIFMSYKANAGSGGVGKQYLNICALGTPENYYLDKVLPNNLYIMRSPFSYFTSISIISTKIADVRVIIEDLLN